MFNFANVCILNFTVKMKKIIFTFLFLSSLFASAQAYNNGNAQEINFNVGLFLAKSTIDFSYEYFLNEDTSIGGTVYFDRDAEDFSGSFGIGPNLRAYFLGYEPGSGIFAEVFGLYYKGEEKITDANTNITSIENYNTLAIGIGGGHKWINRSEKFTLEVKGGVGRNINPAEFQKDFMFRIGLSVGLRF